MHSVQTVFILELLMKAHLFKIGDWALILLREEWWLKDLLFF